jgi:hypothetical protein
MARGALTDVAPDCCELKPAEEPAATKMHPVYVMS